MWLLSYIEYFRRHAAEVVCLAKGRIETTIKMRFQSLPTGVIRNSAA